jgi:hypothetical protein
MDALVGLVACGIGSVALFAALTNWESPFQLDKAKWIERRWGRTGARWFYGFIGVFMITFGILVAMGMAPYTWWVQ